MFNPLRRRQPNYANMAPMMDQQAQPAAAQQPQAAAPAMAAPAQPTAFQQSLNTERALSSNKAANFAAMAPLPSSNGASAYGDVGQSMAARNAYVGDQQA